MPLSLQELIAPITKSTRVQALLDMLELLEFPVSGWQERNPARLIVDATADLYTGASDMVEKVARGGYTELATGDWLDLLIESQYSDETGAPLKRKPGVFTEGPATLSAPTGGPHTIAVGQLTAKDAFNRRFKNTTGGLLPQGGTLELAWKAEAEGSVYNIANNTLTILETPLAGVSLDNPGPGAGAPWYTIAGANVETDAQYRDRARHRWATLAQQSPADAYIAWALEAENAIRKVFVDDQNPRGPGTLDVYIAQELDAPLASHLVNVAQYIAPRRAILADVQVFGAPVHPITVGGTVYAAASSGLTLGQVTAALDAFFAALALGGETIQALGSNRVFRDRIEFAIRDISDGVRVVDLTSPTTDVALQPIELAKPSYALAVQLV